MSAGARIMEAVVLMALGAAIAHACHGTTITVGSDSAPASASPAVAPASAPEPPPPCVRETCAERPKALHGRVGTCGGGVCATYDIEYERHCDCVEWAPRAPKDGGP